MFFPVQNLIQVSTGEAMALCVSDLTSLALNSGL